MTDSATDTATDSTGARPPFIPGAELCRIFYEEAVRPIVERRFPDLRYGAARLDNGSDVLGFDTATSTDHGWGPRLNLYIADADYSDAMAEELRHGLAHELPFEVRGYPTHWEVWHTEPRREYPIKPNVGVGPIRGYFKGTFDPDRKEPPSPAEWLTLNEQELGALTRGPVYRDDTGELALIRERFRWYPRDVWLYLLASVWQRISQEEAFPGRCGDVGDDVGSLVVAGRLVRDVMRLGFLMEREYAPYAKWLGSAFAQLACAPRLLPALRGALTAPTWQERDVHLSAAYGIAAELHNALGITEPVDTTPGPRYPSRPYLGITAERFAKSLTERIEDPVLRALAERSHGRIGNTGHWIDSVDALYGKEWNDAFRAMYATALAEP
ncbi:MAG TPA: DUF4037 domain-containing protein [Chloroflexota bacterium]|nr:DUF4037 domain-containing protein [Chloroflexota bacterium]